MKDVIRWYFWSFIAWCQWHLTPDAYYRWWVKRHPKEAKETSEMLKRIIDKHRPKRDDVLSGGGK